MNEIIAEIGKRKCEVKVISKSEVRLNGAEYQINLTKLKNDLYQLSIDGKQQQIYVTEIDAGLFQSTISGDEFEIKLQTKLESEANKLLKKNNNSNSKKKIIAPMNGLIVKVNKKIGDVVEIGESLLVLEAMKMENEIKSLSSGIIKSNNCNVGESVDKGKVLFIIE